MAPGPKVKKGVIQPINLIFRCLQSRSRVQIWLYEDTNHRIEGYIIGKWLAIERWTSLGFDEYMNIVIDEADDVNLKTNDKSKLGRILLKGDNITLIQTV